MLQFVVDLAVFSFQTQDGVYKFIFWGKNGYFSCDCSHRLDKIYLVNISWVTNHATSILSRNPSWNDTLYFQCLKYYALYFNYIRFKKKKQPIKPITEVEGSNNGWVTKFKPEAPHYTLSIMKAYNLWTDLKFFYMNYITIMSSKNIFLSKKYIFTLTLDYPVFVLHFNYTKWLPNYLFHVCYFIKHALKIL